MPEKSVFIDLICSLSSSSVSNISESLLNESISNRPRCFNKPKTFKTSSMWIAVLYALMIIFSTSSWSTSLRSNVVDGPRVFRCLWCTGNIELFVVSSCNCWQFISFSILCFWKSIHRTEYRINEHPKHVVVGLFDERVQPNRVDCVHLTQPTDALA